MTSTIKRISLWLGLTLAMACHDHPPPHDHSTAHPKNHDHHEEGHGHHDGPSIALTLFSDDFELFAEHPPAVTNREVEFLLHVTTLRSFAPLENARLRLELDGPTSLKGQSSEAIRPGIFQVSLSPTAAGQYQGALHISGEVSGTIDGIRLTVFEDAEKAAASVSEESDAGKIEFLKEQQWGVPFGTSFVTKQAILASIEVAGRIKAPPGGDAEVGAPVTGRLRAPPPGLPRPGTLVRRGQLLASLAPSPSSPEEAARANLRKAEARARRSAAELALERAERLIAAKAISERELEDAQREAELAKESVRAAELAAELYFGHSGSRGGGTWRLTAPINGTIEVVEAGPGATVRQGQRIFRIVDTSELWIVARVPEQDAANLRTDRDGSFRLAGVGEWAPIRVTGDDATASLVAVGRTVDEISRTVAVTYALRDPEPKLRVGGLVRVSLPAGETFEGVVIPRSALVDQDGRHVVYVQLDGEHFEERLVRIGPRSGHLVGVQSGLREGERIVTKGPHLVRLASRATTGQAHGHIH